MIIPSTALLAIAGHCAFGAGGPEEFRLVEVTALVRDLQGHPLSNAQVKAYNEDWCMGFARSGSEAADGQGKVVFRVPVGRYTFCAGSPPDYTASHPGQAVYVVNGPLTVADSCEVTLQPDALTRVHVSGVDGSPLNGARLLVCESSHRPFIHMPHVGYVTNGRVDLATTRDSSQCLLADTVYDPGSVGYVMAVADAPAGEDVWLRAEETAKLSRLQVRVYDGDGRPTKGTLWLAFPELCADGLYVLPEVDGVRDFLVTPMLLELNCTVRNQRGSCTTLNKSLRVSPGVDVALSFGGRGADGPAPLVCTDFGYTEFMIVPTDAFGNVIALAVDPSGRRVYRAEVFDGNVPIASHDLKAEGAPLAVAGYVDRLFGTDRELTYRLSLDLFPLGQRHLSGRLVSDLTWEATPAGPFVLHTPPGFPMQTRALAEIISRVAEAQATMLGAVPAGSGFPAWVKVNPVYPKQGTPEGVNVMFFDGFLALEPAATEFDCSLVVAHEVGHVMQGGGRGRGQAWYMTLPAVEAEANVLALAAKTSLYGDRVAWNDAGAILNREFFQKWQAGQPTDTMFSYSLIGFYVLRRHGWDVHRQSYKIGWLGEGGHAAALEGQGLTPDEASASVLSCLCATNLGWLYRLANLSVDDDQVARGVVLLHERGVEPPRRD